MKRAKFLHEQQRFSIRKYSFGAASVLLGASLVFAGQALADEHHGVSTPSDATLRATSDSDAVTAADIFSGVATDGAASSEKASQVSTTSQTASETATSEARSEVSASTSQAADKISESTTASSEATRKTNASSETATNLDVSALTRAAVNTSLVSQPATTTDSDLPSQGTYVYKERTEIKNQPKVSAKAEFYVNPGDSVLYDQVVTADGYQWISYKSYSGVRRYAPVKPVAAGSGNGNSGNGDGKPSNGTQATTGALNIPATGTFYFTRDTDIKKEPKADLKPTFVFSKGDHVIYDKVLTADNHQWISYLGYDYVRYYADIATLTPAKAETPTVKPTETNQAKPEVTGAEKLPASGTYNVTRSLNVKNEPKASAETLYTLEKGYKVNYDKVLTADNHQWISYISYSGTRRYVDIATLKATESKPQENRVSGNLTINNQTSNGFDVVVTNVSGGGKTVQEVRVPIWSDKNGQDDLTWYHADKQSDGSYKVHVDTASHKGDAGTYSVHLYYMLDGKRTYITETTATVPESQVTGKLTITNQTSNGFDVVVTNVSGGGKAVQEVRVPIWSDKDGQDDLTWYHADKQSDGSYKVHVDTASHKGDAGTYSVHLYYMLDGKRTYITETTATVPQSNESHVTGKLTNNGSYYSVRGKYDDIIIVNKKHGLSKDYNPGENPTAKAAFVRLRDDMINQGLNVGRSYSGFRSYDYQKTLYDNYVSRDGQAAADRYSARPGFSEHQTGLVFDLTDKSGNLLEDARASQWLKDNAHNYGFIVRFQAGKEASTGYMPEAWHIRYVGKEAKDIHDSGLSLEEYFGIEGGDYATSSKPAESKPATTGAINLPATGTYTFTGRASIKAEAKVSSPELAYYDKGMSVNYDKVLTADGHQWLSYMTASGARRYVDIATVKATETKPEVKPVAKPADQPSLPESGTYTFTSRASIKAEAKVSSPELAYYDKGMSVNYDKVLTADGRQWLSYVTTSGARRYVEIAAAKAEAKPETKPVAKPADKPSLPESGRYTFTGRASIKAEAKVSSPELAYYDKGMSVNYDKVLTADGHTWLSYMTVSGARRYVDIA
ncbi:LD-carboxypeptidase LdcB/DacB [Streptococcus salivarius]|uniref:LD-carboxypeptidase LdcB/DacB n=1 Tax=Streptococcus salivarius TaxID=1304 RepID=UPI0020C8CF82|nr:LD-carboxypeptidase LdcB/DacB [Streptococcus salivarius]MCP9062159.1 SH3 domain-containing protein [Streptococcus salivarius]MCP9064072.1 SH3 domain-containing protein [Streptococcus salivarius]